MPQTKNKLKKLLLSLTEFDDGINGTFDFLDKEMEVVKSKLKETITAKSLEEVNAQFKNLYKTFKPLTIAFEQLKKNLDERDTLLRENLKQRLQMFDQLVSSSQKINKDRYKDVANEIVQINNSLAEVASRKIEIPDFGKQINAVEDRFTELLSTMQSNLNDRDKTEEIQKQIKELEKEIGRVRTQSLSTRGGNANRQININSSVMSTRFTDIDFVNGGGIGWTATDVNEKVRITASILQGGGGGGSSDFFTVKEADGIPTVGSVVTIVVSNGTLTDDGGGQVTIATGGGGTGIVRSASVVSVSSTFGATTLTDYVAFPNVGLIMTLPTAINNGNMYTVKNISASSVMVAAAAGQDIDGSATVLMPTQYESLSFISNGSIWGVT